MKFVAALFLVLIAYAVGHPAPMNERVENFMSTNEKARGRIQQSSDPLCRFCYYYNGCRYNPSQCEAGGCSCVFYPGGGGGGGGEGGVGAPFEYPMPTNERTRSQEVNYPAEMTERGQLQKSVLGCVLCEQSITFCLDNWQPCSDLCGIVCLGPPPVGPGPGPVGGDGPAHPHLSEYLAPTNEKSQIQQDSFCRFCYTYGYCNERPDQCRLGGCPCPVSPVKEVQHQANLICSFCYGLYCHERPDYCQLRGCPCLQNPAQEVQHQAN